MINRVVTSLIDTVFKRSVDQHIMVRGAENESTLYTSEGGLVTIMSWHGTTASRSNRELSSLITRMRASLASLMTDSGHAIQITFSRDTRQAMSRVHQLVRRLQNQCTLMELELEVLLEERKSLLTSSAEGERSHLIIYSHPSAISRAEQAEFTDSLKHENQGENLPLPSSQVPGQIAQTLYDRHETFCQSVRQVFCDSHQDIRLLSAMEQATVIAAELVPGMGGDMELWTPRLLEMAGKNTNHIPEKREKTLFYRPLPPHHLPTGQAQVRGRDLCFLGLEHLGLQIARDQATTHPDGLLIIDNQVLAGFDLVLAPQLVLPFNELLQHCLNDGRGYRWRMSWLMEPRGFQGQILKRTVSEIFTFLSRHHNSRIRDAFRDLEAIDGQDDTIVRMRICFALWSEKSNLAEVRKLVSSLRRAIERWGDCRTDMLTGDPIATTLASMPGNGINATAPPMALPLTHALALLPFNRPVSPWNEGSVTLLTPDGRLWPYQSASNLQDSWCDLIVGTPGSGKSVLLNSLNFGALLAPNPSAAGSNLLPLVSIIDIGASSTGLGDLVTDALPPEKRYQVQMVRLANTARQAINIFDTEIGCREPLPLELGFQSNFLQILLADAGEDSVRLSGLIRHLVQDAYRMFSDEHTPKPYIRGTHPNLDQAIEDLGLAIDRETTWWELVDLFSDQDEWTWAEEAQRQAVPVLTDLPVILRTPDIRTTYREMGMDGGEKALAAMVRLINEAVTTWPMLGHPTRFAMGNARLKMVDLQDVTGRGSTEQAQRRSSLMYLLARHVVMRGYYLHQDDVAELKLRPSQKKRLMEIATINRQQPKRLCYDEFHRTGGLPGVVAQIETDVREGRKHNVQLSLASQLLGDFSEAVRSLATGTWICSTFPDTEISNVQQMMGLDDVETEIIRHQLGPPTRKGSNIYVILQTRRGSVRQLLVNRLPPSEIWAYSTTAEDMALRQILAERLGGTLARRLLGERFPGGSARSEITRRQNRYMDSASRQAVIPELAAELLETMPPFEEFD